MSRTAHATLLVNRFPALRRLQTRKAPKQIPFIQQQAVTECGAACLAMVLAYHGKHVTLGEIRDVIGVNRDGVDSLTLLKTARWFGLQGRGVKLELDALPFIERGTILHWEFSHFVVFDRLRKGGVDIVDPSCGRRFVTTEQFSKSFTGVALTLKPGADFQAEANRTQPVWSYMKLLISHSRLLWRVIVLSLLLQFFSLAAPALTGLLVNGVVPHNDTHLMHVVGLGLLGIV